LTKVIWLRHKGGVEDSLAHFGVSGIKGVKGTCNRNCKVMNTETPFQVKVVVTLVGHVEWRFKPSVVHMSITYKADLCIYFHDDSSWN
jgi:hypothetical protein